MKVRIQGTATVSFDQVKEMTAAEFKELESTLDDGDITIAEAWIDASDFDDIKYDAIDIETSVLVPAYALVCTNSRRRAK